MSVVEEIFEKIKAFDTIIIHRHQRPDPDAFGSQCGLAEVLRAAFPQKRIYQVGENVHGLTWIAPEQEIADEVYQNALVIVTDTANQPRIDDQRFKQGKFLIKIDHHPNEDPYGDLFWVNPAASSCSEMIVDFVNQLPELQLTAQAARMLYAGIVGDTGRFMYDATTPHTMRIAAQLMEYDFDQTAVNRKLDDISLAVARLSAYVYENLQVTENKAAYIVLTRQILDKFQLKDAGTSPIVPLPGKIIGVKCWTIFVEQKDKTYRLRIRSKGPVINELAKQYAGGGHPLASGAVIKKAEQIPEYIKKLDEIAKNYTGEIDE